MVEPANPASTDSPQSNDLDLHSIIHEVLAPLIPEGTSVALFDFPRHSNVGDGAIWLGEIDFLRSLPNVSLRHVSSAEARGSGLPELPSSWIILIHGGGNLGDLWPLHQSFREQLVAKYRNHRVIQLPQSIFFRDQAKASACRDVFQAHPDFHLVLRDRESLSLAGQLYDGFKYLCPDMAFCLKGLKRTQDPSEPIVGLLRMDKEKKFSFGKESPLSRVAVDWIREPKTWLRLKAHHIEHVERFYPSWLPDLRSLKQSLFDRIAEQRLRRGCDLLSKGKVVITDRLHAHVLCSMMGIPHVALDNSYGKISAYRNTWGSGGSNCIMASSIDDAIEAARSLLDH